MTKTKLKPTKRLRKASTVSRQPKWTRVDSFYVAGIMHWDYSAEEIKRGQKVRLVHEQSHPTDRYAIAVWVKTPVKWRKVGYIQAGKTLTLHQLKGEGKSFWSMVNQHDLGNPQETRLTVLVKVCPMDYPPMVEEMM